MTRAASRLPAFDPDSGALNVVVETSKGSRNKITYDEDLGLYELTGVLPVGASFPYDFGYVPSTLGADGDPLDALVLLDEPVFAGCLVRCRLIGVITADQTERDGTTTRNDRLVAVSLKSHAHDGVRALSDLPPILVRELEHFFVSYNEVNGKRFEVLGRKGARAATSIVREGVARRSAAHR